jgi:hypothetical protein
LSYFNVLRLATGETHTLNVPRCELLTVVLSGAADIVVGDQEFKNIGRRVGIWDGPADSVYCGTGASVMVRALRDRGVTIILTTHYIEEAEEMADRVGVINRGELILVEDKAALMAKLGKKQLTLQLAQPLAAIPDELADWKLTLKSGGYELEYVFDAKSERAGVSSLLKRMTDIGLGFTDLHTQKSSLEDIFVSLVSDKSLASSLAGQP